MKTRSGFVSNSSSSSFILSCPVDFDEARRHHIKWHRVAYILATIDDLRSRIPGAFPHFLDVHFWVDYEDELRQLVATNPEVCITDAYDRDLAWEKGIDLSVFAEDL